MSKIKSNFLILLILLCCSGCSSVNVVSADVFYSLNEFRDKEVPRLVKYIEEDRSLSVRDRNTFRIKLKHYDEMLKLLKEKN